MGMVRQRFMKRKGTGGPHPAFNSKDLKTITALAKLGATNQVIADFFGVNISSVTEWGRRYPAYKKAFKTGSIEADMKVATSLYRRAIGYTYIEEEYSAIEIDGKPIPMSQMRRVKKVKKFLPPDVKAAMYWLKVRQRGNWILPDVHQNSGSINHLHFKLQDIPIGELTEDAQKLLFEITTKQLSNEKVEYGEVVEEVKETKTNTNLKQKQK